MANSILTLKLKPLGYFLFPPKNRSNIGALAVNQIVISLVSTHTL